MSEKTDALAGADLHAVFEKNGMADLLDGDKPARFALLATHLLSENARYNLTAITDRAGILLRHFADSAACARYLPEGADLLDVGCGAGFPSLPLAICRPDLTITAMDATAKRIEFVRGAAALLGLRNVRTVVGRAEEGARGPLRESFTCVTARAVAALPVLAELCLPYVKVGGLFLAMKAKTAEEEWQAAAPGIGTLGGKTERKEPLSLTDGEETLTRTAILVRKLRPTPEAYPRAYARILKKPL